MDADDAKDTTDLHYREMQFLHRSEHEATFMDLDTYDQLVLPVSTLGALGLIDSTVVAILFKNGEVALTDEGQLQFVSVANWALPDPGANRRGLDGRATWHPENDGWERSNSD